MTEIIISIEKVGKWQVIFQEFVMGYAKINRYSIIKRKLSFHTLRNDVSES